MNNLRVEFDFEWWIISSEELKILEKEIIDNDNILKNKTWLWNDYLWWFETKKIISEQEVEDIIETWKYLNNNFEKVVVVWIWGSYLWAKAILHSLDNYFENKKIIFAWFNLDSNYIFELLEYLKDKNYAVIVISKSWWTLEPALSFRLLLNDLEKKYNKDEIKNRVFAITDEKKWILKELSDFKWIKTFKVPDDVWWRYSVFTAVWLLPIAVNWYDIKEFLRWSYEIEKYINTEKNIFLNPVFLYAWIRNILLSKWKNIELLVSFNYKLKFVSSWWKQLFWESEGKNKKWIFPSSFTFSTDLHSVWQYIQDWQRIIFETILVVESQKNDIIIPNIEKDLDKLNYLSGKSIDFVNNQAISWTIQAHREGDVPIIKITIPKVNEYYIWQLIYFFERSCALSWYLLWVNPFDQPWVESYKKYMMQSLKK